MDTKQIKYLQTACNQILKTNLTIDGVEGPLTAGARVDLGNKLYQVLSNKDYPIGAYKIVGLRMSDTYTNKFSDWCFILSGDSTDNGFKINNKLIIHCVIPISTLPGLYGLGAIMNPQWVAGKFGTAVLKEGYYCNVYRLYDTEFGWSGKPYLAQEGNKVTVYRDGNKTWGLDRREEQTGYFGINFHTWKGYTYEIVNNLSLGCQVCKEDDMKTLVPYFRLATQNDQDKFLDYILIHFNDFNLPLIN